jgi:hypothetical protein
MVLTPAADRTARLRRTRQSAVSTYKTLRRTFPNRSFC